MRGYTSEMRQDLFDAGEHVCLTELNEDGRKAVIKYRKYLMDLTLHPDKRNELPRIDRTVADDINARKAKFFTPRATTP